MANSSEKVSFRVDMQCSNPRELRLFWYSTRVLNRHLVNKFPTCSQQSADSRPTNGQQSADYRQKIFVEGGKRQSTVGRLSSDCWPTVGRLLANSRPTVFWGSCSSFFPLILCFGPPADSMNYWKCVLDFPLP